MTGPTRTDLIHRALRRRCPCCGRGRLFKSFYTLNTACSDCEHNFDEADGSTWFFMYLSSGAVIGVCFLILFFWRPASADIVWASVVMIGGALAVLLGTLPLRKSLAIALDYLIESRSDRE
jgi:uncharacterized protein (DUF983 family)